MEAIFTQIYENRTWGDNRSADYRGSSGGGSDVSYVERTYVPFLRNWLMTNGVRSVADVGCGDFRAGPLIYDGLEIEYTGYDTYRPLIEHHSRMGGARRFECVDVSSAEGMAALRAADVCILKDVIQHWSTARIRAFLDEVRRRRLFRWILITNCAFQRGDGDDTADGGFRPLSAAFEPLRSYGAVVVYRWDTKEVSVMEGGGEGGM